jgi:hypothetical protein
MSDTLECLDAGREDDPCEGAVEYRHALSGTGRSFPRCARHWEENSRVAPAIGRHD